MYTMKTNSLSDRTREIIIGSLLGDGSIAINKGYKNPRFSFRHSINQKEYFMWKVSELQEIAGEKYMWNQGVKSSDGYGGEKLRFQSSADIRLLEIYSLVTKRNKKKVTRKWLNKLTPLSLALWWMDDGSLISNYRKGVLCTDGFSKEEVNIVRRYFLKVLKINTSISEINRPGGRIYYRLYISSVEELKKLLRIIIPHIPIPEMIYKVIIIYKDSELQQRWISEVIDKSILSKEQILIALKDRMIQIDKNRE